MSEDKHKPKGPEERRPEISTEAKPAHHHVERAQASEKQEHKKEDITTGWEELEYSRREDTAAFPRFIGKWPGSYAKLLTHRLVDSRNVAAVVREGSDLSVLHNKVGIDFTGRPELEVHGATRGQLRQESGFGLSSGLLSIETVDYPAMRHVQEKQVANLEFLSEYLRRPEHFRDYFLHVIDELADGKNNYVMIIASAPGVGVMSLLDFLQDRRGIIGIKEENGKLVHGLPDFVSKIASEDMIISILTHTEKPIPEQYHPKTRLGQWFERHMQGPEDFERLVGALRIMTGNVVQEHLVKRLLKLYPTDPELQEIVQTYDVFQEEKKRAEELRIVQEEQEIARELYEEYARWDRVVAERQREFVRNLFRKKPDEQVLSHTGIMDESSALLDVKQLKAYQKRLREATMVLRNYVQSL